MQSPEFEHVQSEVTVDDAERDAYSLTASKVIVDNWWIEQPIDAQWLAAARFVFDDRGEPVIAELRVFPKERRRPTPPNRGQWNARVRGVRAQGVPRGGLPATLLRRRLQLAPLERMAREALKAFSRVGKTMPAGHPIAQAYAGLKEAGYVSRSAKKRQPVSGLGRPSLPDKLLAETARDYVRFLEGEQPLVDLAKAYDITVDAAKGRVKKARAKGFLTPANRHGKAGGSVTKKTDEVLKPHRR
jgi:hypothetical protein